MTINGFNVAPAVGAYLRPDNWSIGACLTIDQSDFAPFRLPSARYADVAYPIRHVEVTGRTLVRRAAALYVRVRITFAGDGEPDTRTGGYMLVA